LRLRSTYNACGLLRICGAIYRRASACTPHSALLSRVPHLFVHAAHLCRARTTPLLLLTRVALMCVAASRAAAWFAPRMFCGCAQINGMWDIAFLGVSELGPSIGGRIVASWLAGAWAYWVIRR
jgi:hypothetical protein